MGPEVINRPDTSRGPRDVSRYPSIIGHPIAPDPPETTKAGGPETSGPPADQTPKLECPRASPPAQPPNSMLMPATAPAKVVFELGSPILACVRRPSTHPLMPPTGKTKPAPPLNPRPDSLSSPKVSEL